MRFNLVLRRLVVGMAIAMPLIVSPPRADAALTFYYDPGSGNLAFDTASTPTGRLTTYQFYYRPGFSNPDLGWFRPENHVRISDAVGYSSEPQWLSDRARPGEFLEGYYSIGDVFPIGLDESTWQSDYLDSLEYYHSDITDSNGYFTSDDPFDFVYGQPDRPFDNALDLVDPSTLTWAQDAVLIYQAWNGEVIMDTGGATGGYISSFVLESDRRFNVENFTPPTDSPQVLGRPEVVGVGAGYPIEPGRYSLGEILEVGMTQAQFESTLDRAWFLRQIKQESGEFNLETALGNFDLVYAPVPEPVFTVAWISLLAVMDRRRTVAW